LAMCATHTAAKPVLQEFKEEDVDLESEAELLGACNTNPELSKESLYALF
jgi:hypothetical protein